MLPTQKLLKAMKGCVQQGRQVVKRPATGLSAKTAVRTLKNSEPVARTEALTRQTGGNSGRSALPPMESHRTFIDQGELLHARFDRDWLLLTHKYH